MVKKVLIITTILSAILFVSFSTCYAMDNNMNMNTIGNDIKNMSAGIEGGMQSVANGVGNVTRDLGNGAMNVVNGISRGVQNTAVAATNPNYTASRTSTATVLGMNATAWTWLIVGIVGVAIVALVWYYGKEHSESSNNNYNE